MLFKLLFLSGLFLLIFAIGRGIISHAQRIAGQSWYASMNRSDQDQETNSRVMDTEQCPKCGVHIVAGCQHSCDDSPNR
jgi:hypothetical protein